MSLIYVYVYNADGHCSYPNDTLAPSELNRSDYQQSVQEMRRIWHRMKCGNETPTSIDRDCCISWCEQLTSFFSQASSWKDHCFKNKICFGVLITYIIGHVHKFPRPRLGFVVYFSFFRLDSVFLPFY